MPKSRKEVFESALKASGDRELAERFATAYEHSFQLRSKPSPLEMLKLYAPFKQGTQDPPFSEAKEPGFLDFEGSKKYNAWKELVESGVTPAEAQRRYIEVVEEFKEKFGF